VRKRPLRRDKGDTARARPERTHVAKKKNRVYLMKTVGAEGRGDHGEKETNSSHEEGMEEIPRKAAEEKSIHVCRKTTKNTKKGYRLRDVNASVEKKSIRRQGGIAFRQKREKFTGRGR